MAKKNWSKVADEQYASLDPETKKDWADLRKRINRFVITRHVHYYH